MNIILTIINSFLSGLLRIIFSLINNLILLFIVLNLYIIIVLLDFIKEINIFLIMFLMLINKTFRKWIIPSSILVELNYTNILVNISRKLLQLIIKLGKHYKSYY